MKLINLALLFTIFALTSFLPTPKTEIRDDFKKFYDQYQVEGSFVLYDQKNDRYVLFNKAQTVTPFIPASTFKILNSLIALETGVVKDETEVLAWDKTERQIPAWNADTDMRNAFKNSTVWYYQELARRIGDQRMKHWLEKAKYGNTVTTGGIDGFWLWGGLRISPVQQIDFLRRLHHNQLPFSAGTLQTVKSIMVSKDTAEYVVRSKTGWGKQEGQNIGWYVGYVTTKDNVYYFANCTQATASNPDFGKARLDIAHKILEELKVTKK